MASKKKEDKIVENASLVSIDLNEKLIRQKRLRDKVRKTVQILNKQNEDNSIYPRQVKDIVDTFTNEIYSTYNLVSPPYAFSSLYDTYEQSDVLQECVDAMAQNVDGFGYLLKFLGNDVDERTTEDAELQKIKAENFFDHINETESFLTLRKEMRKDYEIIGNSALEVLRNLKGDIAVMYNIPFRTIRLTKIDYTTPVWVETTLKRDGKDIPLKLKKYFRKFAQIKDTGESIRWFKEFGDPRVMDAQTGEYVSDDTGKLLSDKKIPKLIASELIHFKNNFGGRTYGLPRWIGVYLDVKGRTNAQFVNYDLFNNQGIPPMAVMVSGGTLTDESVEELEALVRGMRGASQWNKVVLLESNLESSGLEDKGSAKIELKNLTEYRKDDQMFERYIKATERSIRHAYRLPPLYTGSAEAFTHSTSKNARLVAEEQVFMPEREAVDEFVNNQIMQKELNITLWRYSTKGPKIVGSDELSKGVETFSKAGAFTINHAIEMANEAFGLQMSKFSEKWADYPVPIILKLVDLGNFNAIEDILNGENISVDQNIAKINIEKMSDVNSKIIDSELFTDEEKELYKKLITIQQALIAKKG